MLPSLSRGSLPIRRLVLAMLLCGTGNGQHEAGDGNLIVDFEVVNDLGSSLELDSNPNLAFRMAASASDSENTDISAPSAAVSSQWAAPTRLTRACVSSSW